MSPNAQQSPARSTSISPAYGTAHRRPFSTRQESQHPTLPVNLQIHTGAMRKKGCWQNNRRTIYGADRRGSQGPCWLVQVAYCCVAQRIFGTIAWTTEATSDSKLAREVVCSAVFRGDVRIHPHLRQMTAKKMTANGRRGRAYLITLTPIARCFRVRCTDFSCICGGCVNVKPHSRVVQSRQPGDRLLF
jgi:hypothetical protein